MKRECILGLIIGFMAFASGCGLMGGDVAPTATPTASPASGPTATPEYYDGMAASDIETMESGIEATSVPDEFPLDRLPMMDGAQNVFVDEQPMYIAVSFVIGGTADAARAFYEEKGADWANVQTLTGDGEWTLQGDVDGQMLAVTVSEGLEDATTVKIVAFYQRDIEESPETSQPDAPTQAPADGDGHAQMDNGGTADGDVEATPAP